MTYSQDVFLSIYQSWLQVTSKQYHEMCDLYSVNLDPLLCRRFGF